MKSPAQRLELTMELYNQGYLCDCKRFEKVKLYYPDGTLPANIVKHKKNCIGKKKMIDLLNMGEENE